ncbi:UNVERIFIED_CONTAM: hypothetical protein PYX00_003055 [Menopon gallinae]|uniref:Metalloendopeptidase OMA1, mitochondrial n=1 Tax=Menopon gallinae TaxID=328185 RepID=A0AAW2HZD3_9NEOP
MASRLISSLSKMPKTRRTYVLLGGVRSNCTSRECRWRSSFFCKKTTLLTITIPAGSTIRQIQITSPRRALPPLLLFLLRPVTKILAIISGRIVRKWWLNLPPEEKSRIIDRVKSLKIAIYFGVVVILVSFHAYYKAHIVETPITKRKRFLMFGEKDLNAISMTNFDTYILPLKSYIVPPSHPFYHRTSRVCMSLLQANSDLPEIRGKTWSVFVIDRPDVLNAFCYHTGQICVFTGILNLCSNDDQLAIVISHEISHAILNHAIESLSNDFLVSFIFVIPSFICWALFPDVWAIVSESVMQFISKIFMNFPYSRLLEREADQVGMLLAARACYDVREAPTFWRKMNMAGRPVEPAEWLSTHPSDESRQAELQKLLPWALQVRDSRHCPRLKFLGSLGGFW